MKKKYIFNSIAFLLSLFLVIYLIRQISLENARENFGRLDAVEILMISLLYVSLCFHEYCF